LEENEYAQNNMNVLTVMTQQNSQNLSVNDRKSWLSIQTKSSINWNNCSYTQTYDSCYI